MPDDRTTVTELATGLGMLGVDSIEEVLASEPREMASVSPELWSRLRALHTGGVFRQEFEAAWRNGRHFLRAADGLRNRRPATIEWKGSTQAPGDDVVPADLRVDHVFLISCKYLSRIVVNASPSRVFDRLLAGAHGTAGDDWYRRVAIDELLGLYAAAAAHLEADLPDHPDLLTREHRRVLSAGLSGRWPPPLRTAARDFASVVAARTALRWQEAVAIGSAERLLWRLLRIGSAPYFVLGASASSNLRLRIETPWDWRQHSRLVSFHIEPVEGEQPTVGWSARIAGRQTGVDTEVSGHVEIRWSHGKFNGPPEAKVYLDTPHHLVPGYVPLG